MVLIKMWFKNMPKINFKNFSFSPVIDLPDGYEVYDFTQGYDPERSMRSEFGVGRFNEVRKNMYTSELFKGERNIHMGIDIAAPVDVPDAALVVIVSLIKGSGKDCSVSIMVARSVP